REFGSGAGVLERTRVERPDIAVLDIMLPGESGFSLAKRLREQSEVPIIFLTAREAESDRILGFELGADDYVVKPFSPRELVLRVEAVLRRAGEERTPRARSVSFRGHRIVLDEERHAARVDARDLDLTAGEWRILALLVSRPGHLVTREQILREGLDYFHDGSERTVDTHIKNLRAKLGEADVIRTVRGFGYRLEGDAP
ncbi:MAG: winged helix-turn-helix domain-containing protein, partial [Spirochaetales bacterium]